MKWKNFKKKKKERKKKKIKRKITNTNFKKREKEKYVQTMRSSTEIHEVEKRKERGRRKAIALNAQTITLRKFSSALAWWPRTRRLLPWHYNAAVWTLDPTPAGYAPVAGSHEVSCLLLSRRFSTERFPPCRRVQLQEEETSQSWSRWRCPWAEGEGREPACWVAAAWLGDLEISWVAKKEDYFCWSFWFFFFFSHNCSLQLFFCFQPLYFCSSWGDAFRACQPFFWVFFGFFWVFFFFDFLFYFLGFWKKEKKM